MTSEYHKKWENVARDELRKVEDEEKADEEASKMAVGEGGLKGVPRAKAEKELESQKVTQASRNGFIKRMKQIEKQISSPASGDISGNMHGVRVLGAGDVSLNIVNKPIKVFLDECTGTLVRIMEPITTSTLEVYKCHGVKIEIGTAIATIQLDSVRDCVLHISHEDMVSIVHDNCHNLQVHAGGVTQTLPPTTVQSVSTWKDNRFVTVEVVRDAGTFPINAASGEAVPASDTKDPAARALSAKEEGNAAFKACDFVQAAAFYTVSLSCQENDVVYCNRCQCWLKMGQFESALEDARKGAGLNSMNVKAYFRQGIALHALGRYAEAIPMLAKAEELDPKNQQVKDAIRMSQLKARST